jgi:glutamate-1-semialdehyde aminotransferase
MTSTHSVERFRASEQLLRRGGESDAWLATQGDILPQDRFIDGVYPLFADRASGAYFWDVDGNRYIDYILGFGTVILGHANQSVLDAVVADLATGTCISPLWRPRQIDLTELLTSVVPQAEMAFLMKTGSDATSAALRLARIFTGRSKVVRWGYNGWHDWTAPRPAGVPLSIQADTLTFRYNDLDSVREVFRKHGDDIACIVMMPFELEHPAPGFLESVRSIAHQHGALFVLDEMRSGFRMALGGAQEYFGVVADLSTFSKAMSNGHPISAVVGRADLLRGVGKTHMVSTFYGNSAEMAAAIATIAILKSSDAISVIWRLGERLMAGLAELVSEFDVHAKVLGYPPCPFLRFSYADERHTEAAARSFFTETTRLGIFLHPNHHWFVSAAHTDVDIEQTLEACRAGFEAVQRSLGDA